MMFQKKIERALKKLHEQGDDSQEEKPDLEKHDVLAMMIAAFVTLVPIALLVLVGISLFGYFFLMH